MVNKVFIIWFTGLPNSGKTTMAKMVKRRLEQRGYRSYILDGDKIRHGLCSDLTFTPKDRMENIRRIAEVGTLFVDAGLIALVTLFSPYRKSREWTRSLLKKGQFIEIFVNCPWEVCAKRNKKKACLKGKDGVIHDFKRLFELYEPPINPELVIHSEKEHSFNSAERIFKYLNENSNLRL